MFKLQQQVTRFMILQVTITHENKMTYKDKEKKRETQRKYRQRPEVREYNRVYSKEYRQRPENKEKRRKRKEERKYDVFAYYSKKLSNSNIPCCNCCGHNDFLIHLSLDHITNRKNVKHVLLAKIIMLY